MHRVVIIIVSQFVKGGFSGCYDTASSLQHLVVLSLLLLTFSAVLLVELAIIAVGSRGGASAATLHAKASTRLSHNSHEFPGKDARGDHHRSRCWLAGTPLEVSKRRLIPPLLTTQLALWVLQLVLAGRPGLPAHVLLPDRVPCTGLPCRRLSLHPMSQLSIDDASRGHVSRSSILKRPPETAPVLHSLPLSPAKEDAAAWGKCKPTHRQFRRHALELTAVLSVQSFRAMCASCQPAGVQLASSQGASCPCSVRELGGVHAAAHAARGGLLVPLQPQADPAQPPLHCLGPLGLRLVRTCWAQRMVPVTLLGLVCPGSMQQKRAPSSSVL